MAPTKVLVVGAGAVGQVYARHLQRGGAAITFLVRDQYAAATRAGFALYPLNGKRATEPVHFAAFDVVTTTDEVAATTWDYVLLTVSSAALHGAWLGELLVRIGNATLVLLQPGTDDRALATAHVPASRVVSSLITVISYAAPLPGETRFAQPGMAYWFPPLMPALFSGPRETHAAIDRFVALLRRGGQPAMRFSDVPGYVAFPSAILMPWLTALEAVGWKWSALRGSPLAQLAADGAEEALAIVARQTKRWRGLYALGAWRWVMFTLLWFGKRVVPLPLETYVREHFTKVRAQTKLFMARYVELGGATGLPTSALVSLQSKATALATKP